MFRLQGFGAVSRGMGGVATADHSGKAGKMTRPAALFAMPADSAAQVGLDPVGTDLKVRL